jgi:hypothetical protein
MHFENIEDYNFDHGLEFNTQSGEYHSLNPHDLGRPLSHEEMDYNLMYQKQTLNGWRIAGSNADLTLSLDDLGKVLAFHQIAVDAVNDPDNLMYNRHIAAGLFDGQLIWIPVQPGNAAPDPCLGFEVAGVSLTNSLAYNNTPAKNPSYSITSTTATVLEGNVVTFNIGTVDITENTTVAWTIAPYSNTSFTTTTTEAPTSPLNGNNVKNGFSVQLFDPDQSAGKNPIDNDGVSITSTGFSLLDVVDGQISGDAAIVNGMGQVIVQIKLDTIEEDPEMFIFKLAATDGLGNDTNEVSSIVTIINVYNPPTTTADPCVDDIAFQITECEDDITSEITECEDDIASAIYEQGMPTDESGNGAGQDIVSTSATTNKYGSGSGSGSGTDGGGGNIPVEPTTTMATLGTWPTAPGGGGGGFFDNGGGNSDGGSFM